MNGSKTTSVTIEELRAASASGQGKTDESKIKAPHVWDGHHQDERPLTREEMLAGIDSYRRQRGRPVGSDKESTTIRIDRDVLAAFGRAARAGKRA